MNGKLRSFGARVRNLLPLIATLLLAATAIKWGFNRMGDEGVWSKPCTSSKRARLAGVYVYSASFHPSIIDFQGRKITIREAWAERRSKIHHFLVWFPYRKSLDGYVLCFSLSGGKEEFEKGNGNTPAFWVMDDLNESFAQMLSPSGRMVFYQYLDVLSSENSVSLMTSWKDQRRNDITVQMGSPGQSDRIQETIQP